MLSDLTYTEAERWRRLSTGDEDAFRRLFHQYTPSLYLSVLQIVKQEQVAREIVQEVFFKVWQKKEAFATIEQPAGWLFRVASNLSINFLRKQAAQYRWMESMKKNESFTNETLEQLSFKDLQQIVHEAIDHLPPKRKLIFQLSREQGLSHAEIAGKLNISRSTVKNQLVIALSFIQDAINRHHGSPIPLVIFLFDFFL